MAVGERATGVDKTAKWSRNILCRLCGLDMVLRANSKESLRTYAIHSFVSPRPSVRCCAWTNRYRDILKVGIERQGCKTRGTAPNFGAAPSPNQIMTYVIRCNKSTITTLMATSDHFHFSISFRCPAPILRGRFGALAWRVALRWRSDFCLPTPLYLWDRHSCKYLNCSNSLPCYQDDENYRAAGLPRTTVITSIYT